MSGGPYWLSPILTPAPITINPTINAIAQNNIVDNNTNGGYHDTAGAAGGNAFVNDTAYKNGTNFNVGTDPNINPVSIP
jgi:hypothetical protein